MFTYDELEKLIDDHLWGKKEFVIFQQILEKISKETDIPVKELKLMLYHNKSKYYNTTGYINGNKISIQNFIITSKKKIKKIFFQFKQS